MYYYIINPAAGKGTINQIQDKLRARLNSLGISGEFAKTTGPEDATKMTQAAIEKGFTTIVAVGGDGTVNEVINGVTKDNVAVGIVPIGTTNLLANRLGLKTWQQACPVLAARRLSSFGLIAAGQKYFLSSLSLGFETDMEKKVDTAESDVRSRLRQFGEGFRHARGFSALEAHLTIDDQIEVDCELFTLTVANQKFINPLADNRLVITLSDTPSRTKLTPYLWRLIRGEQALEDAATTRFTGTKVLITTKPTTGIMVDGKVAGRTPIAIRLTDRRIRFITEKADVL